MKRKREKVRVKKRRLLSQASLLEQKAERKFYSFVSVAIIAAMLYQPVIFTKIDLSPVSGFLAQIPAKITALITEDPKPKKMEMESRRTENSKTYLNPDGTFEQQISIEPLHYKTKDGMKEIDTSLKKDADGFKAQENSIKVDFDDRAKSLFQLSNDKDDTAINYKLTGSNKAKLTPKKKGKDKRRLSKGFLDRITDRFKRK
ncbi:hypothetical protein LCGC14_2697840 [marine sediment metagenome]|uniref:Uncharacterized protein n=1 Tax=marine sediment metagenome TaxID=412755 RepID=A0A0F9BR33_9ZZZZ